MGLNKQMLPGNVDNKDFVNVEQVNGVPVAMVIKKPPKILDNFPTSPPPRTEDKKEVSAADFPILRGFAE